MKKFALGALLAAIAACGGGSDNENGGNILPQTDGGDPPPTCSPLTQMGCANDEKCTWIQDQEDPPIGHVGCAPVGGGIAIGEACTPNEAGPMGWDDCAKGSVCLSGQCKQICDNNGGTPACDANHSCTIYADFFDVSGTTVAGVCDPGCDPLTQELKVSEGGTTVACGSTMPAMPNKGCYGFDDFSCAPSGPLENTDRVAPRTNSAGNPYLNGCAPGFLPFFFERSGSTETRCSGYCSALEINNAVPNPTVAAKGNAQALGKLPTDSAPVAGNATCNIGIKGANEDSECRFMWQYLFQDDGTLPAGFENGPYLDTLGMCFDHTLFKYDSNNDMMITDVDLEQPSCATLPPPSAATTGTSDDASDFGCMKLSNTPLEFNSSGKPKLAPNDVRLPTGAKLETMVLVRHAL